MLYLLLDQLFLLLAQVHLIHFDHELVPCFFLLDFLVFLLGVFGLDVGLDALGPFASAVGGLYLLAYRGWLRLLLLLLGSGLRMLLIPTR